MPHITGAVRNPYCPVPLHRPLRVQHFIGRTEELLQLMADIRPGHVSTLCGAGGIGKSALAAEAIWVLAPNDDPPIDFPDGVIFHSFYDQPQSSLALEKIAREYNLDPHPSPRDAALHALAGKRVLLVLDSAEMADDLDAILEVAGSCGVVVTTRRNEDARDYSLDLGLMSLQEGLSLLRTWAGTLANDDAAATEIVNAVGGLPLALVLAGHYMHTHRQTATEYARLIKENGLAALHRAERARQSIPLLMRQSLSQVRPMSRDTFGIAGTLALAPFRTEVIAAAMNTSVAKCSSYLGELVNYGLLLRSSDGRYVVIHTLAHLYASTELRQESEVVHRLAQYYLEFISVQFERGSDGFIFLDAERPHIVAVQVHALSSENPDLTRQIAWAMNDYLDLRAYNTDRQQIITTALAAARLLGKRDEEGPLLTILGDATRALGDIHKAVSLYRQALRILSKRDKHRADALGGLGRSMMDFKDYAAAIGLFREQLKISRYIGDKHGEGVALGNMGKALRSAPAKRSVREVIAYFEKQLAIAQTIGDRREEGFALGNLGNTYSSLDGLLAGIQLFEKQLAIMEEIGDLKGQSTALENIGVAYATLDAHEEAMEAYEKALAIARKIGDRRGEATIRWSIGLIYARLNNYALAVIHMEALVEYETQVIDPNLQADTTKLNSLRALMNHQENTEIALPI